MKYPCGSAFILKNLSGIYYCNFTQIHCLWNPKPPEKSIKFTNNLLCHSRDWSTVILREHIIKYTLLRVHIHNLLAWFDLILKLSTLSFILFSVIQVKILLAMYSRVIGSQFSHFVVFPFFGSLIVTPFVHSFGIFW